MQGPLFFNFLVNDLNYFVCNTSLRLYGDDTTEYASDTSPMILQLADLCVLSSWFKCNYLNTDSSKKRKQLIAVGPYEYEFHFNDSTLET